MKKITKKSEKDGKLLKIIKSEEKLRFKKTHHHFLICKWARGLAAMTSPLQGESRRFESDRAHLF